MFFTRSGRVSGRLINRNFALLWSGQGISVLGDFIFDTTLVLWIGTVVGHDQSWAPLAVSGVLLMITVPAVLVGPFAGVFVDRWDKRRVLLWMDGARALLLLCLWLLVYVVPLLGISYPPALLIALLYVVVCLASLCAQFFAPAQLALIGDIVPEEQRARATGLSQMFANAGYVVGPVIASLLFAWLGASWSILLDALSFLVSFGTLLAISVPPAAHSSGSKQEANFWREFWQGLGFSLRQRVLVTLMVMGTIFMLSAGVINTLYLFFMTRDIHVSASLYGLFVAAPGLGGVLGALLASRVAGRMGETRLLWLSSLCWGVVVILLACQSNGLIALGLAFLIGVLNSCIGVASTPLLLRVTPRELVGRVFAARTPLLSLASMLAIFGAGYLSSEVLQHFQMTVAGAVFGPIGTLFLGAGLLVLLSGGYAWLVLRKVGSSAVSTVPEDVSFQDGDRIL